MFKTEKELTDKLSRRVVSKLVEASDNIGVLLNNELWDNEWETRENEHLDEIVDIVEQANEAIDKIIEMFGNPDFWKTSGYINNQELLEHIKKATPST